MRASSELEAINKGTKATLVVGFNTLNLPQIKVSLNVSSHGSLFRSFRALSVRSTASIQAQVPT